MNAAAVPLNHAERRQRNLAVLLALFAVAAFAIALWALWWRPWQAERQRTGQLAERQARALAMIAQRGRIDSALAAAQAQARLQPVWLPEASLAQAIDGLAQQVNQSVALVGAGNRCKVQSRNPVADVPPDRAALGIRLRCGNAELLQLLHLLETSQPSLAIDGLNISAPPQYPGATSSPTAGVLDVGFTLSGQIAPGARGAAP